MDFLKRIQNKPNETKARYAFVTAFSITLAITLVWVTTLPAHFANTEIKNGTEDNKGDIASFADVFKDAKNQVGNIIEYSLEEDDVDTSNLDSLGSFDDQQTEVSTTSDDLSDTIIEDVTEDTEPRTVLIEVKTKEFDNEDELETSDNSGSSE